jgi:hypothetical protein
VRILNEARPSADGSSREILRRPGSHRAKDEVLCPGCRCHSADLDRGTTAGRCPREPAGGHRAPDPQGQHAHRARHLGFDERRARRPVPEQRRVRRRLRQRNVNCRQGGLLGLCQAWTTRNCLSDDDCRHGYCSKDNITICASNNDCAQDPGVCSYTGGSCTASSPCPVQMGTCTTTNATCSPRLPARQSATASTGRSVLCTNPGSNCPNIGTCSTLSSQTCQDEQHLPICHQRRNLLARQYAMGGLQPAPATAPRTCTARSAAIPAGWRPASPIAWRTRAISATADPPDRITSPTVPAIAYCRGNDDHCVIPAAQPVCRHAQCVQSAVGDVQHAQ